MFEGTQTRVIIMMVAVIMPRRMITLDFSVAQTRTSTGRTIIVEKNATISMATMLETIAILRRLTKMSFVIAQIIIAPGRAVMIVTTQSETTMLPMIVTIATYGRQTTLELEIAQNTTFLAGTIIVGATKTIGMKTMLAVLIPAKSGLDFTQEPLDNEGLHRETGIIYAGAVHSDMRIQFMWSVMTTLDMIDETNNR